MNLFMSHRSMIDSTASVTGTISLIGIVVIPQASLSKNNQRMKFSSLALSALLSVTTSVGALTTPKVKSSTSTMTATTTTRTTSSSTTTPLQGDSSSLTTEFSKMCATATMAALLWGSPSIMADQMIQHHICAIDSTASLFVASAKDKASATGSRVNKDPESLLRLGLPINNKEVRKLQESMETVKYDIGSKRKSAALDGVKKSKTFLEGKSAETMAKSCDAASGNGKVCLDLLKQMDAALDPLSGFIKDSQDAFTGSEQERTALDMAYIEQGKVTKLLTQLEEFMVPTSYITPVPDEYNDLPQLKKRATVEMLIKKGEPGAQFDVNGVNYPEARLTMVIDGYTSPITGGNFVDLVSKGFYDKMKIQRSDGFVVQTGDPDGKAVGYTGGKPSKSIGAGPNGERLIPTEIFVRGDDGPFYESTIEDEGRGGEATILPFSSYGAMGWARDEYDVNSGSSQFFWLLFDSDLTPAGKNVLDGRYPCFGYVVEGADFLSDMKEGDVIVSAKVTDGIEYLVRPEGGDEIKVSTSASV